jgi:hypothetical protein
VVTPILTWLQRSAQAGPVEPDLSLDLLTPEGAGPAPVWSRPNARIASAFSRVSAAADRAAERSVPAPVRELLRTRLASWDGGPVGLSRSWVEEAVSALPPADRPAGRLALLVAVASYQIDAAVIKDYQAVSPGDVPLIELVAWAALSAAEEIGAWMPIPKCP